MEEWTFLEYLNHLMFLKVEGYPVNNTMIHDTIPSIRIIKRNDAKLCKFIQLTV